ncbi:hypothetical protein FSOLCH5_013510 [Fusarium solani]
MANSKVIHLHLIDSQTFQNVTGLQPPSTPITAETYAAMALPFFSSWRDEAAAPGVAGRWDDLLGLEGSHAAPVGGMRRDGRGLPRMGLLKSGAWGRLDEDEVDDGEADDFSDEEEQRMDDADGPSGRRFDFPLVVLDPDDTFGSIENPEDEVY